MTTTTKENRIAILCATQSKKHRLRKTSKRSRTRRRDHDSSSGCLHSQESSNVTSVKEKPKAVNFNKKPTASKSCPLQQ
ncbi:hypothetical protein BaRGS_00026370 [Batillaria attramentaria]|uniref:Uncharacterized protein n=1 Tax=Batillaria attramentaria TaxID=370345 RepID=A0ABD0K5Y2_9CAEN